MKIFDITIRVGCRTFVWTRFAENLASARESVERICADEWAGRRWTIVSIVDVTDGHTKLHTN